MSPDPATYTQTSTPLPPSRRMRARFLHEIVLVPNLEDLPPMDDVKTAS